MTVYGTDNLGLLSEKVAWASGGLATLSFGLRVVCRLRYSPRLGGGLYQDDFITLASLLVLLLFCILLTVSLPFGVGRHYNTLSASHKIESLRWNVILNCITPWICTLPKFAIISTLQRILPFGLRTRVVLWSLAVSSQVTVFALMIWQVAQCKPVAFQWDSSIEGGTCANPLIYVRLAWAVYIYSTLLDVLFALYPVPFIMRLGMPLGVRLGVAIPMSLSLVGFAISIYKFSILDRLIAIFATDPSYPLVFLCATHAAEGAMLIIATSLATLRPLFRGIRQHAADLSLSINTRGIRSIRPSATGSGGAPLSACSQDDFVGDKVQTFEEILMAGPRDRVATLTAGDLYTWEPYVSNEHRSEQHDPNVHRSEQHDPTQGKKARDNYPV